jgi:hypothetical protein
MASFIDDEEYEEEEDSSYRNEIRKMFKYDPKKYKHIDDRDIDNMETDYHSQLREERMR